MKGCQENKVKIRKESATAKEKIKKDNNRNVFKTFHQPIKFNKNVLTPLATEFSSS